MLTRILTIIIIVIIIIIIIIIRNTHNNNNNNVENSIVEEATKTMENIGVVIQFEEGGIRIDGEQIDGGWKPTWRRMKEKLKGGRKNKRIEK